MFIAHLPSGYIFAKAILARYKFEKISTKTVIVTMMLGAVFPDIDLVYFFLIDHQQVHHDPSQNNGQHFPLKIT